MNYNEYHEKYKTGKIEEVPVKMYSRYDEPKMTTTKLELHTAKLGDFITDYIEHLSISKWKRNYDWDIVRDKFKETLNQAQVQWHQ